jgi:hypothetical protein
MNASPHSRFLACVVSKTHAYLHDFEDRNASLTGWLPRRKEASASSQARPAPKPRPTHAGHVLRLNSSTENITPKERPRVERMIIEEIARSHFSFNNASLRCLVDLTAGGRESLDSAIVNNGISRSKRKSDRAMVD